MCVQHAGDMIYVPNTFQHLVLNLWPSAAVNHEFAHRDWEETPELDTARLADTGERMPPTATSLATDAPDAADEM